MRIGVDASMLSGKMTGVPLYVESILKAWQKEGNHGHEVILYSNRAIESQVASAYPQRVTCVKGGGNVWMQWQLPQQLEQDKVDVFWGGGFRVPLRRQSWMNVVTIHDLVYRKYPETLPWKHVLHLRAGVPLYLKASQAVLTDAEHTKKDLLEQYSWLKPPITVTPLAADSLYFVRKTEAEIRKVREKYHLPPIYDLYVGTLEPRKGLDTIIDALRILEKKKQLLAPMAWVGKMGWKMETLLPLLQEYGLTDKVQILEYIAKEDLQCLYQGARMFVYPSRYEGFGLPVLEAMAGEIPVITSNASSLPEVAGKAALYIEAGNAVMLAEQMVRLQRQEERQKMIFAGKAQAASFSWNRTAAMVMQVLERVGNRAGR